MLRSLLAVLLGAGFVSSLGPARASTPGPIAGVWQAVEVKLSGPTPRTVTIPEPRANLTILTAKHYSRVEVHTAEPRQAPTDMAHATAAELQAVWGPFIGEAGTYELSDGNVITMRPRVAKNPAAMARGAFIIRTFRLQGDTLWVTDVRDQHGPLANPATAKLVRVE